MRYMREQQKGNVLKPEELACLVSYADTPQNVSTEWTDDGKWECCDPGAESTIGRFYASRETSIRQAVLSTEVE